MGSSIPTVRFCVEAGPSYACSLQVDGSERARWTLLGRAPAELLDAFVERHLGCGRDDARSGPESLDGLARMSRDCLPGPLIDERRLDHLEERLKAADEPGAPPLVLSIEVGDELRNLPLEAGLVDPEFEREGVRSVCLDDRVVVTRRGSGPGLVADSELRALVVDCGDGERLEQKSLEILCGRSVTVLSNPTYAMLEAYLAEDRDHNVLVTIGHMERSSSGRFGSMTFADGLRPCTEVALLVARTLPELKALVLGGCESWSSLVPAFEDLPRLATEHGAREPVLPSIPVLVAHHFKVAPATERGAVRALLREFGRSGRIDVAFRAYRAALGHDHMCGGAMRSSAVLRLNGDGLELVTPDPERATRLRYARAIRQRYSRVRLPGDAKRDVETLRSRGGYLERDITYMVRVKEAGDGLVSNRDGPGEDRERQVREHEALILDRLLKGHRSVVGLKAPAGVGKTALVHNVAYRLATDYLREGSGPLPVCVELRGYGTSLKDLVERTLTKGLTIQDLESGGYILLADGLDEAAGKDRLREEFKALSNTTEENEELPSPSASLVSSRPESARSDLPHFGRDREGREEHVFELRPWDLVRIERYITHHFEGLDEARGEALFGHIKANPPLVQLAGQPLLLWMLCGQAETAPLEQMPSTATALLAAAIGRIVRRRNEHLGPNQRALGEADLNLLTELCWVRDSTDKLLTVRSAQCALRNAFASDRHDAWEVGLRDSPKHRDLDLLLEDLVTRSGLLTASGPARQDDTVLSPSDVRLGDFLVARYVANAINTDGWAKATVEIDGKLHLAAQWISSKAWDPWNYQAILANCCGQLHDPTPLLRELSTYAPTRFNELGDDEFRSRLSVTLACLAAVPHPYSSPVQTIITSIISSVLSLLQRHLAYGLQYVKYHSPVFSAQSYAGSHPLSTLPYDEPAFATLRSWLDDPRIYSHTSPTRNVARVFLHILTTYIPLPTVTSAALSLLTRDDPEAIIDGITLFLDTFPHTETAPCLDAVLALLARNDRLSWLTAEHFGMFRYFYFHSDWRFDHLRCNSRFVQCLLSLLLADPDNPNKHCAFILQALGIPLPYSFLRALPDNDRAAWLDSNAQEQPPRPIEPDLASGLAEWLVSIIREATNPHTSVLVWSQLRSSLFPRSVLSERLIPDLISCIETGNETVTKRAVKAIDGLRSIECADQVVRALLPLACGSNELAHDALFALWHVLDLDPEALSEHRATLMQYLSGDHPTQVMVACSIISRMPAALHWPQLTQCLATIAENTAFGIGLRREAFRALMLLPEPEHTAIKVRMIKNVLSAAEWYAERARVVSTLPSASLDDQAKHAVGLTVARAAAVETDEEAREQMICTLAQLGVRFRLTRRSRIVLRVRRHRIAGIPVAIIRPYIGRKIKWLDVDRS